MMQHQQQTFAFGPVPSRRLGRSLGINNIPPKTCPYSCVYCQLGRTHKMRADRHYFYEPADIWQAVRQKVACVQEAGETISYLSFVPDGEPTLDINLGREIELLQPLGTPIAVITNAVLIWREDVRAALRLADWVSLKVDAVTEEIWQRIDRPYGGLRLAAILEGMLNFAADFTGKLVTETMLVAGLNDEMVQIQHTADFVAQLQPATAYLSIPTRPPAERWVHPPGEDRLNQAYQVFNNRVDCVEYLIGYEGNQFTSTGDVAEDLLSITAVHPMRADAVTEFLAQTGADWSIVQQLIAQEQLIETPYHQQKFYLRKIPQ